MVFRIFAAETVGNEGGFIREELGDRLHNVERPCAASDGKLRNSVLVILRVILAERLNEHLYISVLGQQTILIVFIHDRIAVQVI